jgi:hypothetical protein
MLVMQRGNCYGNVVWLHMKVVLTVMQFACSPRLNVQAIGIILPSQYLCDITCSMSRRQFSVVLCSWLKMKKIKIMLVLSPWLSTDTGTKMSSSFWLFCSQVRTSKTNWPETLFLTTNRNSCRCVCNLRFKRFSCIPSEHYWVLRTMSVPENISTQSKLWVHSGFFCRLFLCFLPKKPGCDSSHGKSALLGCRFDPRNPRWAMNISTQPGFVYNTPCKTY